MRDEEHRPALHERTLKAVLEEMMRGVGVNGGEDVVEKEERGATVDSSREGDAGLLATR